MSRLASSSSLRPRCRALLIAALAAAPIAAAARAQPPAEPEFPLEGFRRDVEVAEWLVRYDRAAWETSDLVLALPEAEREGLGRIWFCSESEQRFRCRFGQFDAPGDRYEVRLEFREDDSGAFTRTEASPLPPNEMALARALHASFEAAPPGALDRGLAFNSYVRPRDDGRIDVWFLPAWQSDGRLALGVELHYLLDAPGRTILERHERLDKLRLIAPDRRATVDFDASDLDSPPIGAVFFALRYERELGLILLWSRNHLSSYEVIEGEPLWVTAPRADRPPTGAE